MADDLDTPNLKHIPPGDSVRWWMDSFDDPVFVEVPFSKFRYVVHGEIYGDLLRTPEVARLGRIKQLGTLCLNQYYISATHPRLNHSLDAAVLGEGLLRRNGFDERMVNHGIVSLLLHDVATPPFSDHGKHACKEELDEERNIELVLDRSPALQKAFRKWRIDRDEVVATVRGEHPVLGQLCSSRGIDLDKVAYCAEDAYHGGVGGCLDIPGDVRDAEARGLVEALKGLRDDILSEPRPFDITESMGYAEGSWIFTEPRQVYKLLLVRAKLARDMYHHPLRRAKEAFLEKDLQRLWREGVIDRDSMLRMDDEEFLGVVRKHLGERRTQEHFQTLFDAPFAEIETWTPGAGESLDGIYHRLDERHAGKDGIIVFYHRPFNPGTSTMVMDGKPEPVPFREAYPHAAEVVERIIGESAYVGVYAERK